MATWKFGNHNKTYDVLWKMVGSNVKYTQHVNKWDKPRRITRIAFNAALLLYLQHHVNIIHPLWQKNHLTFLPLHRHHHVLNFLIPQQRLLQFLNLTILQRKSQLKPQWGEFFRRRDESLGVMQSESQLVRRTFSSLAAINDSTAFFILCTSTSGVEKNMFTGKELECSRGDG